MEVPEEIVCVDCGQTAHRLSYPPEEGWQIGDYVAYRCAGCNDRWDLVVEDSDDPDSASHSYAAEARAILESRRISPQNPAE
jgi:DNA-directed RNA polymerase subunit RPC12/RpoP